MTRASCDKPVIGITGGIGSGKTAVGRFLAELGCVVADSDEMARAALRDPPVRDTLLQWWGRDILDDQAHVDRRKVAAIVFSDPEQRERLERVTHPWIEQRRRELFEAAPPDAPALVIDAPLLMEAGLDRICDAVIFVDAPREQRFARVRAERGWDEAELKRREDSQLGLDVKRWRADYVVRNDADLSDLFAQVRTILTTIVESRRT